MSKLMTKEKANKVYDLLVSIGGAYEDEREGFVYLHCKHESGCSEWRFRGKLGFGGKYRSLQNCVTCYAEDETLELLKIKHELNKRLDEI